MIWGLRSQSIKEWPWRNFRKESFHHYLQTLLWAVCRIREVSIVLKAPVQQSPSTLQWLPSRLERCNFLLQSKSRETKESAFIFTLASKRVLTRVAKEKKNIFFSRDIFVMNTSPYGWSVRRRLSDYRWLSLRLRSEYPSQNVGCTVNQDIDISRKR